MICNSNFETKFQSVLNWVVVVFLVFALALGAYCYLYGIALRNAGIAQARMDLKQAAMDYAKHSYVTNYGTGHRTWLCTNVVSIGGTQYQCFLATTNYKFHNEGLLAMTTNQLFIWIDTKRAPKIVGTHYRAPIFPPQF